MKKYETIAEWENNYTKYRIDKIISDEKTQVLLIDLEKSPYGIISLIEYPTLECYSTPLLNWENLIRCSNFYGYAPEETREQRISLNASRSKYCTVLGYMPKAVLRNEKPAATIRFSDGNPWMNELKQVINNQEHNMNKNRRCVILPYTEEKTFYICKKNTSLDKLFDLTQVQDSYERFGIWDINWDQVKDYCSKDLSFFANYEESNIKIEAGKALPDANLSENTLKVILGLLLGYPIESTVSSINKSYKCVDFRNNNLKRQAMEYYMSNTEPYVDEKQNIWIKENDKVFMDWQQESLYYDEQFDSVE